MDINCMHHVTMYHAFVVFAKYSQQAKSDKTDALVSIFASFLGT